MNKRAETVNAREYIRAQAKAANKTVYYVDRQGRKIREEADGTKYVYIYKDNSRGGYFLLDEL